LCGRGHRRVETEGDHRAGQVVVDRLGDADHGHPHFGEAMGVPQRAVVADGDHDIHAEAFEIGQDPCRDVTIFRIAGGVLDRHVEGVALVGRSDDRAAPGDDPRHPLRRQAGDLVGVQKVRVAVWIP
jgi:hypothetical protein